MRNNYFILNCEGRRLNLLPVLAVKCFSFHLDSHQRGFLSVRNCFSPRALKQERAAKRQNVTQSNNERLSHGDGVIKCPGWSDLKTSLGWSVFVCIVKLSPEEWSLFNFILSFFLSFFFPALFFSSRVKTVKYQSMPASVSPALMEEHATFSPDSKTISGITEIVNNCLTVFQYGSEVFLYEAKDF